MTDTQTEPFDAAGTVWAVFGHRFALDGAGGRILADLGPKGAAGIVLAAGDRVSLRGTRKPSEIKVTRLTLADGSTRTIDWPEKDASKKDARKTGAAKTEGHGHPVADPALAVRAAEAAGYAVAGAPERKPRHFELQGAKDGVRHTVYVALDGTIRKAVALAA
ncbi:hypothetical protein FV242_32520 [Methylobacterium sp. WL64]|uniref:hypothetical protein n=1 Tax=Methylobacterium sp. WL64 TaxID=2603894 RepID=UPI0011C6FBD9|nr:hypothetical protein [Methylobacterium sp. WL64]TXM97054.1 hypothetical protein FV242_32520 [Methylobacterium sp. WL64]